MKRSFGTICKTKSTKKYSRKKAAKKVLLVDWGNKSRRLTAYHLAWNNHLRIYCPTGATNRPPD
jgi:hypothetical protein